MVFAGNKTFVQCAEEQRRYGECASLFICVTNSTTDYAYVASHFTTSFFVVTTSVDESLRQYLHNTCNVIASSRLELLNYKYIDGSLIDATFIIGNKTFNNDPLAFVTRRDDTEWSNIVNWVLQALFFGEKQGITSDASKCQRTTDSLSTRPSALNYLNAVYCVGNYAEIYNSSELEKPERTTINTINNGTAMLYDIPYGNLDSTNPNMFYELSDTFDAIKNRNVLNCGLLVQDGYISEENITGSGGLFGMGVSFCQILASSMLQGNLDAVNFTTFQSVGSSLLALNGGKVDVHLGLTADMSHNFGNQSFAGVTFSTPYYYGNETGR
jgi:ABC-type amino acid transport substrate-binding protein